MYIYIYIYKAIYLNLFVTPENILRVSARKNVFQMLATLHCAGAQRRWQRLVANTWMMFFGANTRNIIFGASTLKMFFCVLNGYISSYINMNNINKYTYDLIHLNICEHKYIYKYTYIYIYVYMKLYI